MNQLTPNGKIDSLTLHTLNVRYIRVLEEPKTTLMGRMLKHSSLKLESFVKDGIAYLTENDYALYLDLTKGKT